MRKLLLAVLFILTFLLTGCTAGEDSITVYTDGPQSVTTEEGDYVVIGGQVDSGYAISELDSATNAFVVIEYEHFMIHEGDTFTVLEVTDLGNMGIRDILLVTPDTDRWAHLVWEIEHELETSIQFYRDTTYTDNGTPIVAFNRNGNSTTDSTTLVYHTPTITNVGTLMGTIQQGDGKKAGGSDREANEFILKQNGVYLIRILNLTVNNNLIFMKLNWYEHANK